MQEVPTFGLNQVDYLLMLISVFWGPFLYEVFRFEFGPYLEDSDSESEFELDSDFEPDSECESDSYFESDEDSELTITTTAN